MISAMISQHPGEELLLDYASGALAEAAALTVACHIALCPACRAETARLEAIGGAAITAIEPQPMGEHRLTETLARLGAAEGGDASDGPGDGRGDGQLPYPLRRYLPAGLDSLRWRKRGNNVDTAALEIGPAGYISRLVRIRPGAAVPGHSHRGNEYTLVLAGGYADAGQHFARGDFQFADPATDHRPVADDGEACLCLVVLDAPLRLTGRFGRLVDPFVRL